MNTATTSKESAGGPNERIDRLETRALLCALWMSTEQPGMVVWVSTAGLYPLDHLIENIENTVPLDAAGFVAFGADSSNYRRKASDISSAFTGTNTFSQPPHGDVAGDCPWSYRLRSDSDVWSGSTPATQALSRGTTSSSGSLTAAPSAAREPSRRVPRPRRPRSLECLELVRGPRGRSRRPLPSLDQRNRRSGVAMAPTRGGPSFVTTTMRSSSGRSQPTASHTPFATGSWVLNF